MKILFHRITTCVLLLCLAGKLTARQYLFVAARKDSQLVSHEINVKTGKLTEHYSLKLPGSGGPMSLTQDRKHLYVESQIMVKREKPAIPHIVSLQIKNGRFKQLHTTRVRLRSASTHVDASGKNLLAAHYKEGKVSVWRIDEKYRCTGELTDDHSTTPRAHFITTDPSNRFAYVPHTAPNVVFQFTLDPDKGKLKPHKPPSVNGPDKENRYHEPRQYAHHSTLPMGYTSNERGGGICVTCWAV